MDTKIENEPTFVDTAKLILAAGILAAGFVGYYYFGDSSVLLRAVAVLVAVAVAAAFGLGGAEVYPTKFQPFSVATPLLHVEGGSMPLPDVPGLGLELRPDLAAILRDLEARVAG